jgi:hypothetical protein
VIVYDNFYWYYCVHVYYVNYLGITVSQEIFMECTFKFINLDHFANNIFRNTSESTVRVYVYCIVVFLWSNKICKVHSTKISQCTVYHWRGLWQRKLDIEVNRTPHCIVVKWKEYIFLYNNNLS